MNCPTCGQVVPVGTRFCAHCGTEVTAEGSRALAPDTGTVVDTGPVPCLVVTAGPAQGQIFELRGEARLGRHRSNAIVLSDGKVSRNHARLDPIHGTYILTDLGSANGTFVNGVRIKQPVRLRDSDLILVGETQLLFYTGLLPRPGERSPQVNYPSASPPASPAPTARIGAEPASRAPWQATLPSWVWIGCAAVVIVILLLIIVALATGILIGQGLGAV
jgi:hypothetical protein